MENKTMDFSHLFLEKKFDRSFETPWSVVSKEAAKWLYKVREENFSQKKIYLFAPSYLMNKSKVNIYKFKKGILFKGFVPHNNVEIIKYVNTTDCKNISFMEILLLNEQSLPVVLDKSRYSTEYFVFFCEENKVNKFPFSLFLLNDGKKKRDGFDKKEVMETLLDVGVNPVRLWGGFDDRELWCEIYA